MRADVPTLSDSALTPVAPPAPRDDTARRGPGVHSAPDPSRRSDFGPLLLFVLFGAFYVIPPQGADRIFHVSGIVEAANALREGQFPVRVAPNLLDGSRYAPFQFYGNFPYTAAALFSFIPGLDAYDGWRVMVFLCVTCAGFYAYRTSLSLTRQTWPSVVAGAVFVASPYLSTDFRARFAYTEAVSFCLLPAVLYYSLRAFVSPGKVPILLGGIFWALVSLSHNITYLYASTLIALFFFSLASFDVRKYVKRMMRLGLCWGLGLLLAVWYVAPQLLVLHTIPIANDNASATPMGTTVWAPIDVLLSPVLRIDPSARNTPYNGLQVGWPILAAALLAAWHVVRAAARRARGRSSPAGLGRPGAALMAALLAAAALAFFVVWSPVDFWRYVPSIFYNLQITYRLLMFVVLWGSLLAGVALAASWRRRPGGMPASAAWVCLLVIAVAGMPFQGWGLDRLSRRTVKAMERNPTLGPGDANYVAIAARMPEHRIQPAADVPLLPAKEVAPLLRRGRTTRLDLSLDRRRVVQLPVLYYPGLLDVRDNGRPVAASGHVDGLLAVDLPPGPHEVAVRFVGTRWANRLSGVTWLTVVLLLTVAAARCVRDRGRLMRGLGSPPPANPPIFPARAAAFGAVLLVVPLALPAAWVSWRKDAALRSAGMVLASPEAFPGAKALNAFDGDEQTEWVASPGEPAWLVVMPPAPRQVATIELEPRQTDMFAGWHEVGVALYLGDRTVAEQTFSLPAAAREPVQVLRLERPVLADGVQLRFRHPVRVTRDGKREVPPESSYCGYREIRIR